MAKDNRSKKLWKNLKPSERSFHRILASGQLYDDKSDIFQHLTMSAIELAKASSTYGEYEGCTLPRATSPKGIYNNDIAGARTDLKWAIADTLRMILIATDQLELTGDDSIKDAIDHVMDVWADRYPAIDDPIDEDDDEDDL